MHDYKYEIQMRAEELAEEQGQDFYALTTDQQCALYERGTGAWRDSKLAQADAANDRERDQ